MKAIHLIHKSGTRLLVGLRPSSFDVTAYAEANAEAMKQLDIIRVTEESLLDTVPTEDMVNLVNELVAELRQRVEEPVCISYAEGILLEVRPISDDDRVIVMAKGRGDTVVNYQSDGLAIDVYADEEIGTLSSNWFDNADLSADEDEE